MKSGGNPTEHQVQEKPLPQWQSLRPRRIILAVRPRGKSGKSDNCNHSEATLKTKITLLPPILIIYLKRYKYGPLTNGKVKKSVRISRTVDLSSVVYEDVKLPKIPKKSSACGQYSYKLQSVVSHRGSSATSGHYVADVCRSDVGSTPLWFR